MAAKSHWSEDERMGEIDIDPEDCEDENPYDGLSWDETTLSDYDWLDYDRLYRDSLEPLTVNT